MTFGTARLTAGYYYYSTEVEIKAFISPIKKEGAIQDTNGQR